MQAVCPSLKDSPLVGLFQAGYSELNSQLRQAPPADPTKPAVPAGRPTLRSLDAVDRALLRATTVELAKLERHVPFLATVASITPFIGLFGTVWGIMGSFNSIGAAGSSSLAVVAPGIAEALIATAAGLFAAIPAVYFYNHFTQRVKEFGQCDGRLLARVPEHLRAELHVMPKVQQHGATSSGRGRRGRSSYVATSLAEINVVPLVDVMLVLLIIFMVTAPMLQQGLEVNLPQARQAKPVNAQPVYVTVPADFSKNAHRASGQEGSQNRHHARARAAGAAHAQRQVGLHSRRRRCERAGSDDGDRQAARGGRR